MALDVATKCTYSLNGFKNEWDLAGYVTMLQRPDSHVVADIALNRVMSICADCGWACEVVHKDYGDDLLVQTSYYGILDHNRIWIQVKGTRHIDSFRTKTYGYSIKVKLDHVLKWARSGDLVLVVLWDVEKDFGLWSIPKDNLKEWDYRLRDANTLRLEFQETSLFDKEQANKIGWIARMDHYTGLIGKALERDVSHLLCEEDGTRGVVAHKRWSPFIALNFLKLLFILGSDTVDTSFMKSYRRVRSTIRSKDSSISRHDLKEMALVLALLWRIDYLTGGCAVSASLLEACTEVARAFIDAVSDKSSGITLSKLTG